MKANPGKLTFGYGLATTPHILAETFRTATGADFSGVPYRGGEQARADLLGGRIDINMAPTSNLLAIIQDGKARPIAFTGPKRSPELPDVPTMIESGYPRSATIRTSGLDSWRPPARRPRSSTRSTPRSTKR